MAELQPKPWIAVIEFYAKAYISHMRYRAMCRERYAHYESAGRFYLGQRVCINIDEFDLGSSCGQIYRARIGDLGTIAHMPGKTDPDYGVILDNDPRGRRHAFGENELIALPIPHPDQDDPEALDSRER